MPERIHQNLEPSDVEKEITPEDFYSELTDPTKHNPEKFCYVVHGIMPESYLDRLSLAIEMGGYDPSQEINLLAEPERIVDKKLISTSIINQNLHRTWGGSFFILDVPWDNFVSMSPRDSATIITNPDFILENARHPSMTPTRLIDATRSKDGDSAYNEVVVTGSKNQQQVRITGIGLQLTDTGEESIVQPEDADKMRGIAKKLGVPTIEIINKVRIEDSDAKIDYVYLQDESADRPVRSVLINRNGYRYMFE